jgi:hypothetical protein
MIDVPGHMTAGCNLRQKAVFPFGEPVKAALLELLGKLSDLIGFSRVAPLRGEIVLFIRSLDRLPTQPHRPLALRSSWS